VISISEIRRSALLSARWALVATTIIVSFAATAIPSPTCTGEEAIQAETQASTLKTWSALFESYRRYSHCDHGAISEGYSNSVATLLASHWDQFGHLRALVRTDPKFESFVLHHVDETMTSEQGSAIKDNIRLSCPTKSTRLCASVMKRFANLGFP
jgi:hypothetical protein